MRRKVLFTKEERIQIAQEYVSKRMSLAEINCKYGLVSKSIVCMWVKRYHIDYSYPKKKISLQTESKEEDIMKDSVEAKHPQEDTQELLSRIAKLEKELKWEKMRTHALETLIDVAEENGLKVRKKSGAKQ